MKERPILFSGPMVRAILDGRKTQTRRVLKFQPLYQPFPCADDRSLWADTHGEPFKCYYGKPGDRLWVRETVEWIDGGAIYRADGSDCYRIETWVWERNVLPSIHMPYGACRIKLEITDIRVERLQDISTDDCLKEGIEVLDSRQSDCTTRMRFMRLWNSINGDNAWDQNPWVWAISFKRIQP